MMGKSLDSKANEAKNRDLLDGLNESQQKVAAHRDGPLIVLAGPGTGKTRVIVARIVHMINDGVDPKNILALTFTNKAAGELRERLAEMLGPIAAEGVGAFTFNGFGAHLLRRFSDLAGLPHEPGLIDSAQRMRLMRTVVARRGLFRDALASGMDSAIKDAGRLIGAMHCAALTAEKARKKLEQRKKEIKEKENQACKEEIIAERARVDRLLEVVSLWEGFDAACLDEGILSFDDQLGRTNRLLTRSETARAFVRNDYRHIVVDEYQDVNAAQIELLRLIAPPESAPDLCVVGDDDQAIYGFRGSNDRAFERFEQTWPGAVTVTLEENYRSATPVLEVAANIIGHAHERFRRDKIIRRAEALGEDPPGSVVEAVRLENFRQAGEVIAQMIGDSMLADAGLSLRQHAVIARTWPELEMIRGALEIEGIRTHLARPSAPAEDEGVLDVKAWMDLLLNPESTWSARRILRRPPNQLDVETVTSLEQRYLAMKSRADRQGDLRVEPFALWAAGQGLEEVKNKAAGSASPGEVIKRFSALWQSLRELAATASAAEVIGEIVRRTDVVHSDLLDGRARALRVAAVVGLMRFAADRADRLEEPGDLRAFVDYCEDLDKEESGLFPDRPTHEPDGDEENDDIDAVVLLTAHSAKGLEFDTVFIPRVESRHGFPSVRTPDEETTLPSWMLDDEGSDRTDLESLQDEERRLFYVACTRAERRLVLLGKVPKSSRAMNFMIELLDTGLLVERKAAEVLGPHPADDVDHQQRPLGWDAMSRRREALRSARRAARLEAASALDSADRAGLDEKSHKAASARLVAASKRLAAIARAEAGEDLPQWLRDDELVSLHAAIAAAGEDERIQVTAAEAVLRPLKGPLTLSYTALKDWEKCPRCYFVKNVLRLPEPEGRQIVVGSVTHRALEFFYKQVQKAGEQGIPEPGLDVLLQLGDKAFDDAWDKAEAVDHDQLEQVRALLHNCYENLHNPSINVAGVEAKYSFIYEHNGRHTIQAKIDRVDESETGFRIVDYKTGRAHKYLLEPKKDDLQLGVYALAIRASINNGRIDGVEIPAGTAEYWVLSVGRRGVIGFDELASAEEKTRERIEATIDGLLSGEYDKGGKCWGACDLLEPGGTPD